MVAQLLVLHLALIDPRAAPEVHLLPPLELSGPLPVLADATPVTGDAAAERPADAAPMVVRAEPRRGNPKQRVDIPRAPTCRRQREAPRTKESVR